MPRNSFILGFLAMIWSLSSIVLINAYTANIVSHFLIPKASAVINSLEELPASSFSWVIRRGTALETLFKVVILIRVLELTQLG